MCWIQFHHAINQNVKRLEARASVNQSSADGDAYTKYVSTYKHLNVFYSFSNTQSQRCSYIILISPKLVDLRVEKLFSGESNWSSVQMLSTLIPELLQETDVIHETSWGSSKNADPF